MAQTVDRPANQGYRRSGVHGAQMLPIPEGDLASPGKIEGASIMKFGERPRDRFEGKPEIISDIAPAHRQRHHRRGGQATIHFQQEGRDPFHGGFAPEQKHVVFRVLKIAGRHPPQAAGDFDIGCRRLLKAAALHETDGRVDDGLREWVSLVS